MVAIAVFVLTTTTIANTTVSPTFTVEKVYTIGVTIYRTPNIRPLLTTIVVDFPSL